MNAVRQPNGGRPTYLTRNGEVTSVDSELLATASHGGTARTHRSTQPVAQHLQWVHFTPPSERSPSARRRAVRVTCGSRTSSIMDIPVRWKVKDLVKIGELAARSGVAPKTLRFYEDSGVIPVPVRKSNGYRDFGSGISFAFAVRPQRPVCRSHLARDPPDPHHP